MRETKYELQPTDLGLRWIRRCLPVVALAVVSVLAVEPARANGITFANAIDFSAGQDWSILSSGGGCATNNTGLGCSTSINITSSGNPFNSLFSFLPASGVPLIVGSTVSADTVFTFTASTTSIGNCGTACGPSDTLTIPNVSGSFSYIGASGTPNAGKNFLTATFTGGSLVANLTPANNGSISYTLLAPGLTMTSSFLNFLVPPQTEEDASWTFTAVTPSFVSSTPPVSGQAYLSPGTYTATGPGSFASTPGFVPEPGSLTLITAGAGFLFFLRRRRIC